MKRVLNKGTSLLIVLTLLCTLAGTHFGFAGSKKQVQGATTVITSMDYYDTANGKTTTKSGVGEVSFGVVLPKFNGKTADELSIDDVSGDLEVLVKQETATGGEWKDIDTVDSFVWNTNFAWEKQQWAAGVYGWVLWMKISETTEIRFHGKTNNVTLDYEFVLNQLPKVELTSISTTESNITADATGGSATHWNLWTFNGNTSIQYKQVEDDITIYVDNHDGKGFVQLLGNADSGFLWDQNFGYYDDGAGGYWFKNINWSFTLRFQKKTDSSIYQDVHVTYTEPVRQDYKLTAYEGTAYDASSVAEASVGIPLPKIGGTAATKKDLDLFVYEVKKDNQWTPLPDTGASGWVYEGNGYNSSSLSHQWGYFVDTVYGLWFRPITEDMEIRISYPIDGKENGDTSNNFVIYTIKGNTEYQPQLPADMVDIQVEDSSNEFTPSGWKMIWNDEFSGDSLDSSRWGYEEGFLLDENDINTAGWGNQELEYYTRDNVSVKDGSLNIEMKKQSKEFSQKNDPSKKATAQYSSGKITTQNKFSVKYGRVDFRAKMPTGTGVWPAMWMLSNDARYGSWPLSGEIDVFEGRGRTPDMVFGTLHYGSEWPNNINTSDVLNMVQDGKKKTGISDWHVYSVVWEAEQIKIYCDGKCYFKCTNAEWYSGSDRGNAYAPFDQRFYLILNLAAGGTFDSGYVPDSTFTSATMQVDYVRVYQKQVGAAEDEKPDQNQGVNTDGADDNLYGDYKVVTGQSPSNPGSETTKEQTSNSDTEETPTVPGLVETETPSAWTSETTSPDAQQTQNNPGYETSQQATVSQQTPAGGNNVVTTKPSANGSYHTQKSLKRTTVKKAVKKKSAKKIRLTFKKVKGAKKYMVQFSTTKKFKKILVKKKVKKVKVTISNRKFRNKKKLYVRVRAIGAKKWSKVKRVKIKK